jgi:tRNA pseudouridine55 synthase
VFKPRGLTSFAMVSLVRRLSHERKVGHVGTLDPVADGVLPVCLGDATRVFSYLEDSSKTYCAQVVLGINTDTEDVEGRVTAIRPLPEGLDVPAIESALAGFRGEIRQVPPMFSALKREGRPLYELARQGIRVERAARAVTIRRLELRHAALPALLLEVECSRGTYIRSLARDLGEALGCGAYLHNLRRIQDGPFAIADALTLDDLFPAFYHGYWTELLYPADRVLGDWPAVVLSEANIRRLRQGQTVARNGRGEKARAYSRAGELVAILDARGDRWQPEKVFGGGDAG